MVEQTPHPHYRPRCRDIVHRWEENPVISIDTLGFQCADIHNAGVAEYEGHILLLITIENLAGQRSLHVAHPTNEYHYKVSPTPLLCPSQDVGYHPHEAHGVMDARVTCFDGLYYIMYTACGDHGYRLGLASTADFTSAERIGLISQPDTKAGALFPSKIQQRYARLERPREGGSIWLSFSEDLIYWGQTVLVMTPRNGFWDTSRIGVAAPPIEIEQGWLLLYYGAKDTSAGPIYRLGAAILSRHDPSQVLTRANVPILSPRETYERIGDIPNIVFSTGAVMLDDRRIKVVYGAANSCICFGETTVDDILTNCLESKREY